MRSTVPRTLFSLQGVFLASTAALFLIDPVKYGRPGEMLEGATRDAIMTLGFSSLALGMAFTHTAVRAPRGFLKEALIMYGPLRFFTVYIQLAHMDAKWKPVAVWEAFWGIVNGVGALLL